MKFKANYFQNHLREHAILSIWTIGIMIPIVQSHWTTRTLLYILKEKIQFQRFHIFRLLTLWLVLLF